MAVESTIWQDVKNANLRVKVFKHCLAAGEPVSGLLRQAEDDLASLRNHLPRGDTWGFCIFVVFAVISAYAVWFFATNEALPTFWGSPAHAYLQAYRPGSAWIWQSCLTVASSVVAAVTAIAFVVGVGMVNVG